MVAFFIVILLLCITEIPLILNNKNKADLCIYIVLVVIVSGIGIYYFKNTTSECLTSKTLTFLGISY